MTFSCRGFFFKQSIAASIDSPRLHLASNPSPTVRTMATIIASASASAAARGSNAAMRHFSNRITSTSTTTLSARSLGAVQSAASCRHLSPESIHRFHASSRNLITQQPRRQISSARPASQAKTSEESAIPLIVDRPVAATASAPIDRTRWVKRPSSLRTKLNSFLVGVALTSIYYYTQVRIKIKRQCNSCRTELMHRHASPRVAAQSIALLATVSSIANQCR